MATGGLEGRVAIVLGVEQPEGRRAAVALAEAGADVAVVTLSEDTAAEFAANSTANEFWAMGRKGIALTSDGGDAGIRHAIAEAGVQLGPVSIVVYAGAAPPARAALAGLRSDPAIIVIAGDGVASREAHGLLAWTHDLAAGGLRANAVVGSRRLAEKAGPVLKEHHPPETMDVGRATAYLASDASAAIEGVMVVAEE